MTPNCSKTPVTFKKAFRLPGHHDWFPAGDYTIETYKKHDAASSVEGSAQPATLLCFQPDGSSERPAQFLNVDVQDIEAALAREGLG